MIIQSVQQTYVFNQTQGAVTEPVNGNWLQAYCEYLGITEPVNASWLQALCVNFGITAPLYGSWTIALANYYGITATFRTELGGMLYHKHQQVIYQ